MTETVYFDTDCLSAFLYPVTHFEPRPVMMHLILRDFSN